MISFLNHYLFNRASLISVHYVDTKLHTTKHKYQYSMDKAVACCVIAAEFRQHASQAVSLVAKYNSRSVTAI